jgi:RNA recognition motif-containing protein
MSEQSRQKATVFVGGLDNNVNEQTLHDAFIPFGEIVEISIPKPELYVNQFMKPSLWCLSIQRWSWC